MVLRGREARAVARLRGTAHGAVVGCRAGAGRSAPKSTRRERLDTPSATRPARESAADDGRTRASPGVASATPPCDR
eukprot:3212352-Prymnesium_polylepis.1